MTKTNQEFKIPVIDFAPYFGTPADRVAVSNEIANAFQTSGFIYLKNHTIPTSVVNSIFEQSKKFFALPNEQKNELQWETPESNRGYVTIGREKLVLKDEFDISGARVAELPDMKETFEIGKEPSTEFKNNWPKAMPLFQQQNMKFFDKCNELHLHVMNAIGLGLGLPDGYFNDKCDQKDNNLRLLHYPSCPKDVLKNRVRAGAHSDYGSITLLFQDMSGGLEVMNNNDEYVMATPIADTIVINAGDLLARWSNDFIKSTVHRVVIPPFDENVYPDRYSIAYFCSPNKDTTIDCLPGCNDGEKKYEPINAFEYLVQRLSNTY